ncbi:MAG: alpha/beta hydrolase [Actinomycetota bacterium]|nr:alpha/beta hydrolase [Actinomycetota bacterium]MDK1017338.1 alpha/beta hydrolase [Actinomycetota bacterium]MDK1025948.1 alpha/beta hydrolase [Actinomycetota bacterium]MDK1039443.1 alpha/beta hydrolase [Actinomycetota bacterium]MDK1095784.1 alpha/beta hydrolase [Actinomycetota bacterium]
MRSIETNGVTLAVDDQGTGDAVVLLHGFPELAYSWRHQIPALVDAGYRAVSFDQRGYGASSKPQNVTDYSLDHLVGDVIGVLDRLGIEMATVVGHDWGSIVAWTTALVHPDRISRVVSLNVPYRGACIGFPTTDVIREKLADRFGYVLMFQEEGVVEAMFEADPEAWLKGTYAMLSSRQDFLSDAEFTVFADAFRSGGISGPVNWYRNIDRNAADFASYIDAPIVQPTLMLAAEADPVLPVSLTHGMVRWATDLTTVIIEGSGHWTQQEQPDAVNAALLAWLDRTTLDGTADG